MSLKIGVTGGIGSGKSIICKIFSNLGIPIYDADSRAKIILIENEQLRTDIIKAFGSSSYLEDGSLNRGFLAKTVFADEPSLAILNALVHPKVGQDYLEWVSQHPSFPYTIKEAALMFESGSDKNLDTVIAVSAPEAVRIERVLKRDAHRTEKDVRDIISRQMDEDEKLKLADHIIYNDGKQLLIPQVLELHHLFRNFTE